MSTGRRRPADDDHTANRITAAQTDRVRRHPDTRPGWTVVRQGAEAWLEHDTCRRTLARWADQEAHEELCR